MVRKKLSLRQIVETITFEEGFNKYIDNCTARNLRPATIKHYKESFVSITKFIDKDTLVKNLDKNTVNNFVIECKKHLDVTETTIYTYTRDLKTLMYFFMQQDYIPSFKIKLPKVSTTVIETYTDGELIKLLRKPNKRTCSFSEYKNWVLVNFLLSTGVRLSSFMDIKIKDVDFYSEVVHINTTKSRKALIIPLNPTIVKILKEYLQIRQQESDEEYLFCNVYGKKLNKNTISEALRTYNRNRGIVKTGIHRYRHTFAKKWILAGGSVVTLQKILGHSNLSITEGYINLLVEDLKKEVDKFNILEEFNVTKKQINMRK